ncbi:MAG: hypothetical protein K5924_03535 [Chloroflexi bacterium]|nr:hypothetical protein [Chloroflexota bacterium]
MLDTEGPTLGAEEPSLDGPGVEVAGEPDVPEQAPRTSAMTKAGAMLWRGRMEVSCG